MRIISFEHFACVVITFSIPRLHPVSSLRSVDCVLGPLACDVTHIRLGTTIKDRVYGKQEAIDRVSCKGSSYSGIPKDCMISADVQVR